MSPSETVGEGDLLLLISSLGGDRNSSTLRRRVWANDVSVFALQEPSPRTINADRLQRRFALSCWFGP
jgi:hypothetical protein